MAVATSVPAIPHPRPGTRAGCRPRRPGSPGRPPDRAPPRRRRARRSLRRVPLGPPAPTAWVRLRARPGAAAARSPRVAVLGGDARRRGRPSRSAAGPARCWRRSRWRSPPWRPELPGAHRRCRYPGRRRERRPVPGGRPAARRAAGRSRRSGPWLAGRLCLLAALATGSLAVTGGRTFVRPAAAPASLAPVEFRACPGRCAGCGRLAAGRAGTAGSVHAWSSRRPADRLRRAVRLRRRRLRRLCGLRRLDAPTGRAGWSASRGLIAVAPASARASCVGRPARPGRSATAPAARLRRLEWALPAGAARRRCSPRSCWCSSRCCSAARRRAADGWADLRRVRPRRVLATARRHPADPAGDRRRCGWAPRVTRVDRLLLRVLLGALSALDAWSSSPRRCSGCGLRAGLRVHPAAGARGAVRVVARAAVRAGAGGR